MRIGSGCVGVPWGRMGQSKVTRTQLPGVWLRDITVSGVDFRVARVGVSVVMRGGVTV